MRPRVLLCCPIYQPFNARQYAKHKNDPTPLPKGLLHPETRRSIKETVSRYRDDVQIGIATVIGVACIEQARGYLYGQYKATGRADYLWMVDADVSWDPDALGVLMDRDLPLVGAAYCLKQEGAEKGRRSAARFRPNQTIDDSGLTEAEYLNGGFMFIRGDLLQMMEGAYPELAYMTNPPQPPCPTYGFWHPMIVPYPPWVLEMHPELGEGAQESISEDWAFCHRARGVGAAVINDCSIDVGHWAGGRCYRLPSWNPGS